MRLKDFDFKDKKNKILILGGSILVLLVGGLGLYFNSSNPSYDDIPTSNKKKEQEEEVNINSEESKKKVYVSDIDISDVGKIDEINKNIKDSEKETIKKEEELENLGQNYNTEKNSTFKEEEQKKSKPNKNPVVKPEYDDKNKEYEAGSVPGFDNINTDDVKEGGVIWEQVSPPGDWNNKVGQ
nr:hypothetical protein [Clostridioides sp.]